MFCLETSPRRYLPLNTHVVTGKRYNVTSGGVVDCGGSTTYWPGTIAGTGTLFGSTPWILNPFRMSKTYASSSDASQAKTKDRPMIARRCAVVCGRLVKFAQLA
jgi:hypothetical protein